MPLLAPLAIASQSGTVSASNYESESANAGYPVPNVPVRGVSQLTLADIGTSLQIRDLLGGAIKLDTINKNA